MYNYGIIISELRKKHQRKSEGNNMTVSEMIALLEEAKAKYGDLDIAVSIDSGYSGGSCTEYFDEDAVEVIRSENELRIHVGNSF